MSNVNPPYSSEACQEYLVTGISRGLGKSIALTLLYRGFSVLGVGRRPSSVLMAFPRFQWREVDLSDFKQVDRFVQSLNSTNTPRHLILNAALIQSEVVNGIFVPEVFTQVMNLNFHTNISILVHVLPIYRLLGQASVCAIASQSVVRPIGVGGVAYAASKSALASAMEAFRLDPLNRQIGFTTVFPAGMDEESRWPQVISYRAAAKRVLRAIDRGKSRVYIPRWKYWCLRLSRLIPDACFLALASLFRRQEGTKAR